MNWPKKLHASWRGALTGGALCAVVGLALLRWAHELVWLSYDLLFVVPSSPPASEVVIIYMDDHSFKELRQTSAPAWDLNLHAELVDRLTDAGARLVVFDVVFTTPALESAMTNFARAIRRNGRVVLAASLNSQARPQIQVKAPVFPWDELLDAAAGWGIAEINSPRGTVARQYYIGDEARPSLPWAAATLAGAVNTKQHGQPRETWLNYYGPALSLPHLSYAEAGSQPPAFFHNKVVWVGVLPKTLHARDEADVFRTPHSLWGRELFPGVEVGATAFLNMIRGDGLMLWPWARQSLTVLGAGLILGAGFGLLRPWAAGLAAVLAMVLTFAGALGAARQHLWFGWTIIAFAQIPCALAWSIRGHFHRLKFQKEVLERTLEETTRLAEATRAAQKSGLVVPDHTLVRLVGKGAYGEVWLARNAIGVFHAVKIVRRQAFPQNEPYEREFRGIQKFMPISRSHPGLVHVLHVGRNDEAGFFFCIMEAADDQTSGQRIDPESYSPRTLGTELARRGKLSPEACLQLGLSLTLALEHLHQQQLIHRDIKPGNIIYVNGSPKFADIGLVTDIARTERDVSNVGTHGYIAPEGPGAPAADVYALGKVLYEASMGRDRCDFPEVPTAVLEESGDAVLHQLNQIIGKACESEPRDRYRSAAAMHTDLLALQLRTTGQAK